MLLASQNEKISERILIIFAEFDKNVIIMSQDTLLARETILIFLSCPNSHKPIEKHDF